MRAALGSDDVVYEAVGGIVVSVVVLHGDLDIHIVLCALAVDDLGIKLFLSLVQICDKFLDTALVMEALFLCGLLAVIYKGYTQIFGEERGLPESYLKRIVIKYSGLEYIAVGQEGHLCTGFFIIVGAYLLQRVHGLSALVSLLIYFSVAAYLYIQPFGKSVYDGSAYSVQTAGHLISSAAELASRVKHRKYHLDTGKISFVVDARRYSAPVVRDRD